MLNKEEINEINEVISKTNDIGELIVKAYRSQKMYFDSPTTGAEGTLPISFEDAKVSFFMYMNDGDRLRSSDDPKKILKGFKLNLDNIKRLTEAPGLKELFLMFGKAPDRQLAEMYPNDPTPFKDEFTIMVLGLDEQGLLILEPKENPTDPDIPIIYEYLSPCPNSCSEQIDALFTHRLAPQNPLG